jgi:patatin-like phospholipase/acyl hydrolase
VPLEDFKTANCRLDGGGVRGLSSLLIIKELMKMIKDEDDPNPHPCQYFDMIAGTSTGG